MRIFPVRAAILVTVLFLFSCNRNHTSLDYTNAKGEVQDLQNLVFRFSNAVVPDSLLNNWDSTEYVTFEPKIRGRFRWESPDQLVFSPREPLAPATGYKVKIRGEVLRHSKYDEVKDADKIAFHTAPLQLHDAQATWVLSETERGVAFPHLHLQFNYPVDPQQLKNKLEVRIDGAQAPYVLQNASPSRDIIVRLTGVKNEDKNREADIVLTEGLVPVDGKNSTSEKIQTLVAIPSPYVLLITSVEAEHTGTEGIVHINTSQQLAPERLTSLIKFNPEVPYRVEYTSLGVNLISDSFSTENSYTVNIQKGLRGTIGGVLQEAYYGSVSFGQLEAGVKFTSTKGTYLSKRGSGNLQVLITNTPKVKLVISRIYEGNLMMAQRYGYTPNDRNDDAEYASYSDGDEYSQSGAGDVVFTKEIDTRTLPRSGNARILNISQFEDRLSEHRGIYHVVLRSMQDYWVQDSRFISFSDIGLIAREGRDKMLVFANSIKSAEGISGVTVNVYGSNNLLLGTAETGSDGVAEVKLARKDFAGFRPAMIIAKTPDDFTYLHMSSARVNMSRFEVGGRRNNPTGLDAFLWAERDIYRPGEKISFALMLRKADWKSPGELPVKLKFVLPNGKELKTFRKTVNEGGIAEGSLDIAAAAITGSYTLEAYSSNDILLASKNFMVEEFVPDRIRVSARLNKSVLRPGDEASLLVNAVNFFGPPAANRTFETEIQLKQKNFTAKNFPGYDFQIAATHPFIDKQLLQGTTDAGGNATLQYTVPAEFGYSGLLQANFYTTVFDETGRPVSRVTIADVVTQPAFFGIKDDGLQYYALNQPVRFGLISLSKDGTPLTATARVQVVKHAYRTVLVKSGSYFRYDSQKEVHMVSDVRMSIGSASNFDYVPRTSGDYELRIFHPGATSYVSKRFYSYGGWGDNSNSFEVNNEGHIDIEVDKERYRSGETAKVLFKAPFSGRMLVTTERDGVFSHQYVQVVKRSASIELKLDAMHVPNMYITATLIKPHEVSDIPLTVAHGFKNVMIVEDGRKMPVNITTVATTRSRRKQVVKVKAAPNSYITLAAVDNGVLQVSDFKTPDPYAHYYQQRALEVGAYDMYPLLFPEARARLSSTGGDGGLDMSKRGNPMPSKRVKILSYWSGVRKANGSGVAEFSFDIPQFSGQVRLMAVASRDDQFGSAEAMVQVADPVVISSSLPRFLSPGDTALVPVTITNTTGRATNAIARLSLDGGIRILGPAEQTVSVGPNSEARTAFRLVAAPAISAARVLVSVSALGEVFREETELSVRPPSTLQKLSGSGSIAGGKKLVLPPPANDFLPGTLKYELVVSRSPIADLAPQLRYLLAYPYGCTEQTISAAFPQLYYSDFADLLNVRNNGPASVSNVMEAIRTIKMRQLYNGAVTLWDGESREDWWTTTYAAHFLLEARKAGFDVDNSLLETMLTYLTNRLKRKETITYYYNRDQNRKIAPKEVAYSLYVLAMADRTQVSAMNYYKAAPQLLALDGRYLLSAAYAVAGDKRSFQSFLPSQFAGEQSVQQTGGSFYSETRDEAIALNALLDVDPGNAQVGVMARHVSNRLRTERYLNTQERAFSFLALGKIARRAAASTARAEIKAGGRVVARINGSDWKSGRELRGNESIEITTSGSGSLYYSWVAEGVRSGGSYTEEDNFIKVRRSFFTRDGRPVAGNSFAQNDLVIVALSLEKAYTNTIENIVITDLLPAGFEIENARTKELPGMDWIKGAAEPTTLDVRDDRIHFFVDAVAPKQTYYYAVRAVSLGTFRQGPVNADALYNGEIHSYHGAGVIRILPR